jgi:excinuclease ABC subunit C
MAELPARLFIGAFAGSVNAAVFNADAQAEAFTMLEHFFEDRFKTHVEVLNPVEKKDLSIMNMLAENLREDMARRLRSRENAGALEELQKVLNLGKLPRRIEGFDIAQLHGKFPVASLVSFFNGRPDKSAYRYFRLKTTEGMVDDYESIREAVARRYTRVINENLERPDLILIDGGKGQVSAALGILESLGLGEIPLAGLAKQNEEIYLPKKSKPLVLPQTSQALKVLQAVRDETHRFATSLNQKLRLKTVKAETLESIPGIGPVRSKKLLTYYGSLEALGQAPVEEVAETGGFSLEIAQAVNAAVQAAQPGPDENDKNA